MGETMIPYPGMGSGHAGNATSRERQETEDANGMTEGRQQAALAYVAVHVSDGVTVAEVQDALGVGHGQASSALSHLHRAGKITRIKSRRNKQEIYVLPEYVNGRDVSPYNERNNRKHPKFYSDEAVMKAMKAAEIPPASYRIIRKFLEALP